MILANSGLRRLWNRARMVQQFLSTGGRLRYDGEIGAFVAEGRFDGRMHVGVCVRSYRELRRVHEFGRGPRVDSVWRWLNWIGDCTTLYDVGSSNGLEGLYAMHRHGCSVVFIEPYTPSIESLLKSVYIARRRVPAAARAEIVHAGCGDSDGYARLLMHGAPNAGENMNTFGDASDYIRYAGDNPRERVAISQWVKAVSIDGLIGTHGLPSPSHVKIDVDGFECRVLAGAANLLKSGRVASWAIEANGDANVASVDAALRGAGYVEAERFVHYPGVVPPTMDIVYVRPERIADWQAFACGPRT